MRIIGVFVILITQSSGLLGDDGSARRYGSMEADPIVCKYSLLATKQVQQSLRLTQAQIESLKPAMAGPPDLVPGIVELRRSRKQLLEAAQSDEERSKIRSAENEKASLLIRQHWATTLQSTLSPAQAKQLDQLLLQMKGPNAILEDTNAIQTLRLSEAQISQLNQIAGSYKQLLSPLLHRFLGLQINVVRQRSKADVNSESESLIHVIKETERDRDYELLNILDQKQRSSWDNLTGKPVSIKWKTESFAEVPFKSKAMP